MGTSYDGGGLTLTRERCDKCGSDMALEGAGHGFERWTCPNCRQVVGIDRDETVGGRTQLQRGRPWRYAPTAFRAP